MGLAERATRIWRARDELSPRNFRGTLLAVFLVLPLTVILGDLRYLDQELALFGVDSNNLILMAYGLGFLAVTFAREARLPRLLRAAVLIQTALLAAQLCMGPGVARLAVYLAFHAANGVCTACGYALFVFALNNVERIFTMVAIQLYYVVIYLLWPIAPIADFLRTTGSALLMLALAVVVFAGSRTVPAVPARTTAPPPGERTGQGLPGARESGVFFILVINLVYYVINLMVLYLDYEATAVSEALFSLGGLAAVGVILVVMLWLNYSALHLWNLCLICSVLGIGALYYTSAALVNAGSFCYGLGEGLGFMIIFYLQGGAIKRSGSFKLLRLWCLFTCINYVAVSGAFFVLYEGFDAPYVQLAFPAVLLLALCSFLLSPLLQKRLFATDWTDGYYMADMPLYADAFRQVEKLDSARALGLTPREMEVFTMLLTEASPKQIAATLRVSYATVNFHSKNLYRKLNIQSRTELFALYGGRPAAPV